MAKHLGIDIGHGDMTADDLKVIAPAAGTVTAVGEQGTYGLRVIIDHGDEYSSLLAHLSSSAFVTFGQKIAQGGRVGVMGHSGGDWPVHLHQELRLHGIPIDPEPFLTGTAGTTTTPTDPEEDDMSFIYLRAGKLPNGKPNPNVSNLPIYQVPERVPLTKSSIGSNDWAVLRANGAVVQETNQNVLDAIPGS